MTTTANKPRARYELLDGLRGVAALMVILYHVGECFATSARDQWLNHGYLAVDFFFVLSGFVLGYAYDGRWNKGMTTGGFLLRRVIRLQPMVLVAVVLGAISFVIQGCEHWDGTSVSMSAVILSFVMAFFMLPALPGTAPEIRGNGEMFPINGPSWSLFFEYIGSIFYALFLHRLSTRRLKVFVVTAGIALAAIALGNGSGDYHLGVGWTAAGHGFWMGLARMTFSFSVGLLLSRTFKPVKIRGAFWICSALIVAVLSVPYVGGAEKPMMSNAVYDLVCTVVVFPLIVYLGASGTTTDRQSGRICEFLGAISYPVYIIHYPFMYLMYAWAWKNGYGVDRVWPVAAVIIVTVIVLAWMSLKYYDEPVRRWLSAKLLKGDRR